MEILKEALISILGEYTPIHIPQTIQLLDKDGNILQQITNEYVLPDIPFVFAAILFVISIYSLFRIVGSVEMRVR